MAVANPVYLLGDDANPGGGGCPSQIYAKCSEKPHEIENQNWSVRGRVPGTLTLDSPLTRECESEIFTDETVPLQ